MQVSRLRLRVCTHDRKVGALRQHFYLRCSPVTSGSPGRRDRVARSLAAAFRSGDWTAPNLASRGARDLGVRQRAWIKDLAAEVVEALPSAPDDAPRALVDLISARLDVRLQTKRQDAVGAWIKGAPGTWDGPQVLTPTPIAMAERQWPVPEIADVTALARFFGMQVNELEWYCDVRSLERHVDEVLRHYDYHWRPKRRGGARLIEAPKQNLKELQRKVLRQILRPIPPHDAAHGFRQGRSIQTYAMPHTGQAVVIRLDLRAFFTTVRARRVFAIFRTAGYAEDVAHLLAGLTTNAVPAGELDGSPVDVLLRAPHLPQGAPTSPALANLAAFGLDRRLSALAHSYEARYTRYADDLAISGGPRLARKPDGLVKLVAEIASDEGFTINKAKTQVRTQTQRQLLTGMVVNQHLNVHRRDYDRLKAILHDAARHGAVAANRNRHASFRAHLEGRISFVQATNPSRARKLWNLFDQVDWSM